MSGVKQPEITQAKLEEWPTGFFDCCAGGISLCLWGFLCTHCLAAQGYTHDTRKRKTSQLEEYPPWSCRGVGEVGEWWEVCLVVTCLYGVAFGFRRHVPPQRHKIEYYCSNRECCCYFPMEDCLIGHFCCCCSVIQLTMAREETFRMSSKVEGDVNIKRAL